MMKRIPVWLLLIIISTFMLTNCISYKRSAVKGIKSDYETFFINETTDQYFIKPITFQGQGTVEVDFTFRKTLNEFSNVVVNFSVLIDAPDRLEKMLLVSNAGSTELDSIEILYKKQHKDYYHYRFTSVSDFSAVKEFFTSENQLLRFNDYVLSPSNKSAKTIASLKSGLFEFQFSGLDSNDAPME